MWGRVPLPHTYVNIPMGCVCAQRTSPSRTTLFPSIAQRASPLRTTLFPSVAQRASPSRTTLFPSVAQRASPSRTTLFPSIAQCASPSRTTLFPSIAQCENPSWGCTDFPRVLEQYPKNPQYGAAPVSTGVWRLDKRAAAPDRHKTGNLKIN